MQRKYSASSDVWSYGIVMFEIWSLGCKPFEEKTAVEVSRAVVKGVNALKITDLLRLILWMLH